jgi:DNA-binding CsgD family transcriptional regulator
VPDDAAGVHVNGNKRALSPREREVLDAVTLGLTNREIAIRLGVTVHAVKFHLASIYRKLGAANRTEAVAMSLRADEAGRDTAGGRS